MSDDWNTVTVIGNRRGGGAGGGNKDRQVGFCIQFFKDFISLKIVLL